MQAININQDLILNICFLCEQLDYLESLIGPNENNNNTLLCNILPIKSKIKHIMKYRSVLEKTLIDKNYSIIG
jgi:hypothetical protein